jgi:hypothetical protein
MSEAEARKGDPHPTPPAIQLDHIIFAAWGATKFTVTTRVKFAAIGIKNVRVVLLGRSF